MLIVTGELKEKCKSVWQLAKRKRKMLSSSVFTMQDVARIYNHVIQNVRHRRGSQTKVELVHFKWEPFPLPSVFRTATPLGPFPLACLVYGKGKPTAY